MHFKSCFFYGFWFVLTILLAYWFSYPLDIFSRHSFWGGGSDATPSLWVLNWQLTQLSSWNFDQLFTGNSFYPLDRPIHLSVSTFSTAILTLPIFLVTKDPYICYAAAIFFSYILSSTGMLLLARSLKLDYAASFLAALIFAFSESRLGVSGYIHILTIQWIPFTLFFVHKYFDKGRRVFLYWAALFYLIQITASAYHGIFFSIILLLFVLILFRQQDNFRFKTLALDAALPILIVGTVASAYFIPYLQEANEFGFKRSIAGQAAFGAPLVTFFSSPNSYFFSSWTSYFNHIDGNTSPRYLPILLTAVALLILRKKNTSNFLINSKLKNMGIGLMLLTPVMLVFKPSVVAFGEKLYPDLLLHPQAITTVILSPLFLVVTARFFMTKFFRAIYLGLRSEKIFLLYFSIAVLAFMVSLGPIIKLYGNQHIMINPIDTFLYYVFPGFSSIRAISRMSGLIPLGLGITSGISFMLIRERMCESRFKNIFSFIVLTVLMLEIYPAKGLYAPYKQPKDEIPLEYLWLKQVPDGPVLEWPINKYFVRDVAYLEGSMIHQKKLVNGFGAFEWDGRKKLSELTDFSSEGALLSLYAFGVRYLVVHTTGGKFPQWAGKTLGKFQQVEKFDNALVYLNENAKTQFLPESFLNYFSATVKSSDDENRLVLTFQSPDSHYVSKNKKLLKVKVNWRSYPNSFYYDWPFYPTLWRNGDSHELVLDKGSGRVPEFVELIYSNPEKNGEKVVRKIVIG